MTKLTTTALLLALLVGCSDRQPASAEPQAGASFGGNASSEAGSGSAPGGGTSSAGSAGAAGKPNTVGGAANCAPATEPAAAFVHPGGLHKRSDLERMRLQVAAGQEPWKSSFDRLKADTRASAEYVVRGDASWTTVERGGLHGSEFESDANAAYLNALMWAITGEAAHARKSVEIFNTWKNLTAFVAPGTPPLDAGLFGYKLLEAAEIIRSTFNGWAKADVDAFSEMLVYPGYSSTEVPSGLSATNGSFYWRIYNGDSGRHGNQDLVAWRAMLIMGVFLDNRVMYERALRYFKGLPHRDDDLPYAAGPSTSGAQTADNEYFTTYQIQVASGTPDYGYNGVLQHYIWENGQSQESSRDQQHAFFGLGLTAGMAEVAWNQGDGVWNALDQRLLKGFEFSARYNASYLASFPDQVQPWEPTGDELIVRTDRTGRWRSKAVNPHFESDFVTVSRGDFPGKRPVFEQALAHFQTRMGVPAEATLWTTRARDLAVEKYGQEPNGFGLDHPGWGGLTFRRPPGCAGDPISGFKDGLPQFELHAVPGEIPAADYDYFPVSGEGHTFQDLSPGNSGEHYRKDDVDLTCGDAGPVVTGVEAGEWLTYTLAVPQAREYVAELRYRASGAGAAVRFAVDGGEPNEATALPSTAGAWDTSPSVTLQLRAGAQALRLLVDTSAAGLEIASITLR
ncbi:MAG TPA: carbohydrate-binding domain-containing protein [Polyangiaceae bacterium]|nr:carbohydrate-binding domain-containing protein [Polyangiaceae bacterium]